MPRVGDLITGHVVKIVVKNGREIGAIVKYGTNESGFLPVGELKKREDEYVKDVTSTVKFGDEVTLRIIKIDYKNNKITLSLFRANNEVNNKLNFEKKMTDFLETSKQIQIQLKKNTDRKQGRLKKNQNSNKNL
jgi:predicted RNA-binding protein with RPS1 domain